MGFVETRLMQCLVVALAAFSLNAARPAASSPRSIRVLVDNDYAPYDYAPYSFQSDDGQLQGIVIDQWKAWEKKTGVRADIQAMDWNQALRRMRAGEFDVIDCIFATDKRQAYFDFTPAYA